MKEEIEQFKAYWREIYSYISLELTDDEITRFIVQNGGVIRLATNQAQDYLLAQGLTDVQE